MTLELSGTPTPLPPYRRRGKVIGVRVDDTLAAWVEEQAAGRGVTVNRWMADLLDAARDAGPRWPADVESWLLAQAAACGRPGDVDHALTMTVRDLSRTYPLGCRLR